MVEDSTWLAMSLARQGKLREAAGCCGDQAVGGLAVLTAN